MFIGKREDIMIDGLFVQPFAHGVLEGMPEAVRHHKLRELPNLAAGHFGSYSPLWVDECPEKIYDLYTVIADLKRIESGNPEYDISILKIATFSKGFPERPVELLEFLLERINWEAFAMYTTID